VKVMAEIVDMNLTITEGGIDMRKYYFSRKNSGK